MAAVLVARAPDLSYARNAAAQARIFPARAVSYIQAHRIPGPLLNSYDWGGYLIWTLGGSAMIAGVRSSLFLL